MPADRGAVRERAERVAVSPVRVAVPAESAEGETRVALTPDAVRRLVSEEVRIAVEAGAGVGASHADEAYREAGAEVVGDGRALWGEADILAKVAAPGRREDGAQEVDLLREGAVLVCFLRPRTEAGLLERLATAGVTALALELVPRITRAQAMDALTSTATLAGYKAALLGAGSLNKVFPLLMTAAGTLSPARVLVLGAGVAGLQAIATARRLGAVVEAYDIRPAVKEQVESLGATFVEWDEEAESEAAAGAEEAERETEGGYAVELAEDEQARERLLLGRAVERADVVITTALVPGKPAPLLVTEEMVSRMRPGSVIVDLAAEMGGNCELSEPDRVVRRHGVLLHAPTNLAATLPVHASQMFARNVSALLGLVVANGRVEVDLEDEILDACCVTHDGRVRFEP